MKIYFLLIVMSCWFSISAQTAAKKEILLDENGKSISEDAFIGKIGAPDYKYTYYRTFNVADSTVQNCLVLRNDMGKITQEARSLIVIALKEVTGHEVKSDQIIIINYFCENPNLDMKKVVTNYSNDKKFKRLLQKDDNYAQFFIAESIIGYASGNVFADASDKIRDMLFPLHFPINYIIIRPDGSYFTHLDEYGIKSFKKNLQADWNLKTK